MNNYRPSLYRLIKSACLSLLFTSVLVFGSAIPSLDRSQIPVARVSFNVDGQPVNVAIDLGSLGGWINSNRFDTQTYQCRDPLMQVLDGLETAIIKNRELVLTRVAGSGRHHRTTHPINTNEYVFRLISSDSLGLHVNYRFCHLHNNSLVFWQGESSHATSEFCPPTPSGKPHKPRAGCEYRLFWSEAAAQVFPIDVSTPELFQLPVAADLLLSEGILTSNNFGIKYHRHLQQFSLVLPESAADYDVALPLYAGLQDSQNKQSRITYFTYCYLHSINELFPVAVSFLTMSHPLLVHNSDIWTKARSNAALIRHPAGVNLNSSLKFGTQSASVQKKLLNYSQLSSVNDEQMMLYAMASRLTNSNTATLFRGSLKVNHIPADFQAASPENSAPVSLHYSALSQDFNIMYFFQTYMAFKQGHYNRVPSVSR